MNLYYSLPDEIIKHIHFFVLTSYVKTIIFHWRKYNSYFNFIIENITFLPKFTSEVTNRTIVNPNIFSTYFFFKSLFKITYKPHKYIQELFYDLTISIIDYEFHIYNFGYNNFNLYYLNLNKYICINIAHIYNWYDILLTFNQF